MPYYDSDPPVYWDSGIRYDSVEALVGKILMAKISLRLDKRTLDDKLNLTDTIAAGLVEYATIFTNPAPPPADMTAKATSIRTKRAQRQALLDEAEGLSQQIEVEEAELDVLLSCSAKYAEAKVSGDGSKLAPVGFPLQGEKQTGDLTAPLNFIVNTGKLEGECTGRCKRVSRATSYEVEAATSATGPWTEVYNGTRVTFTAANLVSGQLYYFRMRAIGSGGKSPWSDIAQKRAA